MATTYIVNTTKERVQATLRWTRAVAQDRDMRVIIVVQASGVPERSVRSRLRHFLGNFHYFEVCSNNM